MCKYLHIIFVVLILYPTKLLYSHQGTSSEVERNSDQSTGRLVLTIVFCMINLPS
jgi:hypothetical protein